MYFVNKEFSFYPNDVAGIMIKAKSFSYLGQKDSALYYADKIMHSPYAVNKEKYNALYILTHDNSCLSSNRLLSLTSDREDINNHEYAFSYITN